MIELTGHASAHSRIVRTADEGGPELTRALARLRGRTWRATPVGLPTPRAWEVIFGRIEPGYQRQRAYVSELLIYRTGQVMFVRDSLVSPLPIH